MWEHWPLNQEQDRVRAGKYSQCFLDSDLVIHLI